VSAGPAADAGAQAAAGSAAAGSAAAGEAGLDVLAGLDAGGSKLAIRVETLAGERVLDTVVPAAGWEANPADAAAEWLTGHLARILPPSWRVRAAGVGAQGCDSPETSAALQRALAAAGLPAVVVNDGALLVPAAGLEQGIGLVAGTGSIGIGADAAGQVLIAGGWGWVIGDEGGAPALVREATRAALTAHDSGDPDDGLLAGLLAAFGVPSAERLARAVNDEPTPENWGPRAPAVFEAADAGSALAAEVISDAGAQLAHLVGRLRARGAVGTTVVAAGGVITSQPRLADTLRARLAADQPDLELRILTEAPVAGAITLARRLLTARRAGHPD
jgi:N-acetylglucosamine kinase-like BadF-type ATPase